MIGLVHGGYGEGREFKVKLIHAQAEAQRGVNRVTHVQVVRPALGPVFPGVATRVGAHKMQLPAGGRPIFMVAFETAQVVRRLIAKQRVKAFQPRRIGNQAVPVIVTRLMTKMAQQRAVGLAHGLAHGFALGVVGFIHIEGDQAGVMSGHDMRAIDG